MKIPWYQATFSTGFVIPTYLLALNSSYVQIFSRNTIFFILITCKLILCDAPNDWFETLNLFSLTISHQHNENQETGLKLYTFSAVWKALNCHSNLTGIKMCKGTKY
jgi:hypothetical protein